MKILFFTPSFSSFVIKDIKLIETKHKVWSFDFRIEKKIEVLWQLLKQIFIIPTYLFKTDLIICRFIGYHSLIPALFGKVFHKPVLAILGGNECHYFPAINYGNYTKTLYSLVTKISFRLADHIAPVDDTLVLSDYNYDNSGAPKQGYLYFYPSVKAPFTVVYNGYDPEKFYPFGKERKNNSFLAVALDINGREFYRKGIDLIFAIAPSFPQCSFTVVGKHETVSKSIIPSNLKLITRVNHDDLINLYNDNEYYMQLSLAEGFPNSLCEAMLCGCIPIGSNVFAIPKIISDSGFILNKKNISELESIINKALNSDKLYFSEKARTQIIENFPISKRQEGLLNLIDKLVQ